MLLAALLLPFSARAEIMVGESLDWRTIDANLVSGGRVARVSSAEVALTEVVALRGTVGPTRHAYTIDGRAITTAAEVVSHVLAAALQPVWPAREAAWGALVAHSADLSGLEEPRRQGP